MRSFLVRWNQCREQWQGEKKISGSHVNSSCLWGRD
jgi:hypothetical protein